MNIQDKMQEIHHKFGVEALLKEQKEQLNITVVSSRFDDIYTHPFRVGRKQGKAVLDAKGLQVVFMATEKQAQMYCTYLNGY